MGIFSTFSTFNVSENKPKLNRAKSLRECFSFLAVLIYLLITRNNKYRIPLFLQKSKALSIN